MAFWNFKDAKLEQFRPGIKSRADMGENLVMACMEIAPDMEDAGHSHPFDQCGIVLEGEFEMTLGEDRKKLKNGDCYFIPSGVRHGWKTHGSAVKLLDVSLKQPRA